MSCELVSTHRNAAINLIKDACSDWLRLTAIIIIIIIIIIIRNEYDYGGVMSEDC